MKRIIIILSMLFFVFSLSDAILTRADARFRFSMKRAQKPRGIWEVYRNSSSKYPMSMYKFSRRKVEVLGDKFTMKYAWKLRGRTLTLYHIKNRKRSRNVYQKWRYDRQKKMYLGRSSNNRGFVMKAKSDRKRERKRNVRARRPRGTWESYYKKNQKYPVQIYKFQRRKVRVLMEKSTMEACVKIRGPKLLLYNCKNRRRNIEEWQWNPDKKYYYRGNMILKRKRGR